MAAAETLRGTVRSLDRGEVPPGHREVLDWRLCRDSKLCRMARPKPLIAIFALSALAGFVLAAVVRGKPLPPAHVIAITLIVSILVTVVLLAVVAALHELVHGIVMRRFGARPVYGVLWEMGAVYATAPGFAFRRNAYVAIALAPLGLSLIYGLAALLAPAPLSLFLFFAWQLNTLGAIGDVWSVRKALRYPSHAYVIDEKDGMRVFLPEREAVAA